MSLDVVKDVVNVSKIKISKAIHNQKLYEKQ